MMNRFFFFPDGHWAEYDPVAAEALLAQRSDLIEVLERPAHGLDRMIDGEIVPYTPQKPINEVVREAYIALPIELQAKYEDEITKAAFHLERGNLAMVGYHVANAEAKLNLPAEQAVKDIIDGVKAALQL